MEVVKQLEMRTKAQLEEIVIYIPEAEKVSKEQWLSGNGLMRPRLSLQMLRGRRQTGTTWGPCAPPSKALELLPASLPLLGGDLSTLRLFLPNWIILLLQIFLCSITATWDYCSCKCFLRSAWTALTALSGQLDQVRRTQGEFTVSRKELLAT